MVITDVQFIQQSANSGSQNNAQQLLSVNHSTKTFYHQSRLQGWFYFNPFWPWGETDVTKKEFCVNYHDFQDNCSIFVDLIKKIWSKVKNCYFHNTNNTEVSQMQVAGQNAFSW